MTNFERVALVLLRLALGWLFLYSGATKVLDPDWSSAGYLKGAQTLGGVYAAMMSPGVLPVIDAVNAWGQTLLGVSLVLGLFVRLSSALGALLMLLYYLPVLKFPYVGQHSFLVDEHVIYGLALLYLAAVRAGRWFGLEGWCSRLPICARFPQYRRWLG